MSDKLARIAALVKESRTTSNAFRIRQIESSLTSFRQSNESWDDARDILVGDGDPDMQYFALSVLEDWIASRWKLVSDARRADLASFLLEFALQSGKALPFHVYMYLLKVISHIGRLDWPKRAPEFLFRVLEIASTPETSQIGVNLLKLISEEWTNSKSRIKSTRRIKLRHMLAEEVPQIVAVLTQILSSLWMENVQEIAATPSFGSLDSGANYISNFGNNTEAAELAKSVLEALQSFIAWAPLNVVLQPAHIDILFKFVLLNDVTSCLALDNLNEMLERNFVPVELAAFLVQLHGASLTLLAKIVRDPSSMASLDANYVEKWTHFLNLFVQYHLRRDESLNFSEFLSLFTKYSFMQPSAEGFLDCLDIWEVILTLLENHVASEVSIEPFCEVICELTAQLMRSVQFRHNAEQLSKLDATATTDETALTEEEESSELDQHINSALTVISLAYSLYPEQLLPVMMSKVMEPIADFSSIHTVLSSAQMTDDQVAGVYYVLRDTNTVVRAIALIGSQFTTYFDATFNDALTLLRTLVDVSSYIKQHELQKYSPEAARLAAELFGAMRAFSEWCAMYWNSINEQQGDPSVFDEIVSAMLNCDGLVLNSRSLGTSEEPANIPEVVPLSAAVHVRNLSATVKSPRLANLGVVSQLLADAHTIASYHTTDVQQSLYTGLAFIYLVPWASTQTSQQQWDLRASAFAQFMEGLIQPFEQAATLIVNREEAPYNPQLKELVDKTLVVLTGMLRESAFTLDKSGLSILWNSLQDSVKASVALLEHYLDDLPMLFRLLQLHIQVFSVLAPQVPQDLATSMVGALIGSLSSQPNRLEELLQEGGFGSAVAQRLLCLLKALISRNQAPFLEDVFNFCVEKIFPSILADQTSPDVEQSFYEVWCCILTNHYKFLSQSPETYRIGLNCFLRAFQGQDLDIFRIVIASLMEANTKRGMFSQPIFWSEGYASFLSTLFNVMIHKSHESLHEEILKLIFDIIQGAGFEPFFDQFIPSFLSDTTLLSISPEQREALRAGLGRATDPPTLCKSIENLLGDLSFMSGALRQQQ